MQAFDFLVPEFRTGGLKSLQCGDFPIIVIADGLPGLLAYAFQRCLGFLLGPGQQCLYGFAQLGQDLLAVLALDPSANAVEFVMAEHLAQIPAVTGQQ